MSRCTSTTTQLQERGLQRLQDPSLAFVIGIDEVGYGAWAGPVVVCAAVAPAQWSHPEVKDSKLVSPVNREALTRNLLIPPIIPFHCILSYSNTEIDERGVGKARDSLALRAARRCLEKYPGSIVAMDGNVRPAGMPDKFVCMPKADNLVPAVSAASIIAKVYRDELMRVLALEFPGYDFEHNVGYRSDKHVDGLNTLGVSAVHRQSYSNIRQLLDRESK